MQVSWIDIVTKMIKIKLKSGEEATITEHVFPKHVDGTGKDASVFTNGRVAKECIAGCLNEPDRVSSGQDGITLVLEKDMGYNIGTLGFSGQQTSRLRVVCNKEGRTVVITAHPVR